MEGGGGGGLLLRLLRLLLRLAEEGERLRLRRSLPLLLSFPCFLLDLVVVIILLHPHRRRDRLHPPLPPPEVGVEEPRRHGGEDIGDGPGGVEGGGRGRQGTRREG